MWLILLVIGSCLFGIGGAMAGFELTPHILMVVGIWFLACAAVRAEKD